MSFTGFDPQPTSDVGYEVALAKGFATLRAHTTKSLASGLSVRFLTVMMLTGTHLAASFSGSLFKIARVLSKLATELGSIPTKRDALEADHQFLLQGEVFTRDVVETYIGYKRSREIDEIRLRPHPYEFLLYYDV